jgi:hypothetical protein
MLLYGIIDGIIDRRLRHEVLFVSLTINVETANEIRRAYKDVYY